MLEAAQAVNDRQPERLLEIHVDLEIADVYHAPAYYHDHPEEVQTVEAQRQDAYEAIRESVDRPLGVEPPSADE